MSVLIFCPIHNGKVNSSLPHMISAALKFAAPIDVVLIGQQLEAASQNASKFAAVNKVITIDSVQLDGLLAEPVTDILLDLYKEKNYQVILSSSSTTSKNILPRLAAKLDVMQISDVVEIIDADTFVRPIYAGNALITLTSHDAIKILTIRPAAFPEYNSQEEAAQGEAAIEQREVSINNYGSKLLEQYEVNNERPDLSNAKIIISGGRALDSAENFAKYLTPIAHKLNAAIGASRAAVDLGFAANDLQIGQTGKIVAPELYIAIGISGAIQHIAGISDSGTIVAINKDPEAPIFQIADYGLIGDLFTILPLLEEKL